MSKRRRRRGRKGTQKSGAQCTRWTGTFYSAGGECNISNATKRRTEQEPEMAMAKSPRMYYKFHFWKFISNTPLTTAERTTISARTWRRWRQMVIAYGKNGMNRAEVWAVSECWSWCFSDCNFVLLYFVSRFVFRFVFVLFDAHIHPIRESSVNWRSPGWPNNGPFSMHSDNERKTNNK